MCCTVLVFLPVNVLGVRYSRPRPEVHAHSVRFCAQGGCLQRGGGFRAFPPPPFFDEFAIDVFVRFVLAGLCGCAAVARARAPSFRAGESENE